MADEGDDVDMSLMLKKKKKKAKKVVEEPAAGEVEAAAEDGAAPDTAGHPDYAFNDREYTYAELLSRVFVQLAENNAELVAGKRFSMRPPQVVRDGTKKTVVVNFAQLCGSMRRSLDDVQQYFNMELGTTSNMAGDEATARLTIKGKYYPKQIEQLTRKYMMDFVQCQMCRSFDTQLVKDPRSRLQFIQCNRCGARRSVSQSKNVARATTRAERRAART